MALQVNHPLVAPPLPALPAAIELSVMQAKVRLLELGDEAQAQRQVRMPLMRNW